MHHVSHTGTLHYELHDRCFWWRVLFGLLSLILGCEWRPLVEQSLQPSFRANQCVFTSVCFSVPADVERNLRRSDRPGSFSEGPVTVMCWLLQLLLPPDWFPLNRPGVQEYLNVLYNFTAPLLLLRVTNATQLWKKLWEVSGLHLSTPSPPTAASSYRCSDGTPGRRRRRPPPSTWALSPWSWAAVSTWWPIRSHAGYCCSTTGYTCRSGRTH